MYRYYIKCIYTPDGLQFTAFHNLVQFSPNTFPHLFSVIYDFTSLFKFCASLFFIESDKIALIIAATISQIM